MSFPVANRSPICHEPGAAFGTSLVTVCGEIGISPPFSVITRKLSSSPAPNKMKPALLRFPHAKAKSRSCVPTRVNAAQRLGMIWLETVHIKTSHCKRKAINTSQIQLICGTDRLLFPSQARRRPTNKPAITPTSRTKKSSAAYPPKPPPA